MPTLTSATARVHIAAHGAELTSFVNLATGLEYVWPADPAQWARHAPLLFPIVGKLPEDTYLHNGQTYKLALLPSGVLRPSTRRRVIWSSS